MHRITVIISTDGRRPDKLRHAVAAIRRGSYRAYRLIVLQQTDSPVTLPPWVDSRRIAQKGVSYSKNVALGLTSTPVIAFTDDDCLPDRTWLSRIAREFADPATDAVFGKAVPYAPTRRPGFKCPSVMLRRKRETASTFTPERSHLGIGCNMAFRTKTLKTIGGFSTWLGPGTDAPAAEDVEALFRLLKTGHRAVYEPSIVIRHDRWLTPNEYASQYRDYYVGLLAAYSYHMFMGDQDAARIVRRYWRDEAGHVRSLVGGIIRHPKGTAAGLTNAGANFAAFVRGMVIGWVRART